VNAPVLPDPVWARPMTSLPVGVLKNGRVKVEVFCVFLPDALPSRRCSPRPPATQAAQVSQLHHTPRQGGRPHTLPIPVPCSAYGTACAWISVGADHPSAAAASASGRHTPSAANAADAGDWPGSGWGGGGVDAGGSSPPPSPGRVMVVGAGDEGRGTIEEEAMRPPRRFASAATDRVHCCVFGCGRAWHAHKTQKQHPTGPPPLRPHRGALWHTHLPTQCAAHIRGTPGQACAGAQPRSSVLFFFPPRARRRLAPLFSPDAPPSFFLSFFSTALGHVGRRPCAACAVGGCNCDGRTRPRVGQRRQSWDGRGQGERKEKQGRERHERKNGGGAAAHRERKKAGRWEGSPRPARHDVAVTT
jgi:hypothetical protein